MILVEKESFESLQATLMMLVNEVRGSKKPEDNLTLLSVKQLTELWDFDEQTIMKHLKANKVNPVIFSDRRSIRYRKSDIEKFIKSKELPQWQK